MSNHLEDIQNFQRTINWADRIRMKVDAKVDAAFEIIEKRIELNIGFIQRYFGIKSHYYLVHKIEHPWGCGTDSGHFTVTLREKGYRGEFDTHDFTMSSDFYANMEKYQEEFFAKEKEKTQRERIAKETLQKAKDLALLKELQEKYKDEV